MGKSGPRPGQSAMLGAATTEIRELIGQARGVQGDVLGSLRELKEATIPAAVEQAVAIAVEQRIARMETALQEAMVRYMALYERQISEAFERIVRRVSGIGGRRIMELGVSVEMDVSSKELAELLRQALAEVREEESRER